MALTANYCSYIYLCVSAGLIQVMNGFSRASSATGASPLPNGIWEQTESMPEKMNFGKSLLVPSVQELAKQKLTNIPARYVVHPGQESPAVSAEFVVPVIDVQKLISGDSMDSELQKLHSACQQWGFLQNES
ncbi:hypothetical protein P3S67_023595 [Capsicum chacoense]